MFATAPSGPSQASEFTAAQLIQSDPPPPPPTDWSALGKEDEKVYTYRVYKPDGTYIGVWGDVKDDLEFTQPINSAGTTTTVQLARSANTRKEVRTTRSTQDAEDRITQDGDSRVVTYQTSNTVGEDTDVELNYNVDVYVHYGDFEERETQDGIARITQDGEERVVTVGAPLGTRIFSGFILDYTSGYGETVGVTVTLSSHGFELSNQLILSGTSVNVTYSTTAIETIIKSILDTNPGKLSYSTASIESTGRSVTIKFQLNTKLEGIESAFNQTPDGWYWYGNVAENVVYLKQRSSTPDHTFILGTHVNDVSIKRSIESLQNLVYFVGGQTTEGDPSTTVFKKYEDTASQTAWRVGLNRITDRRFTVVDSIANYANREIARYKDPIYTTPLTISSARYNLESIKLGQMVGFANFDNFVDDLLLQIVSLSYTPTAVTVQLGDVQERQIDLISNLDDQLSNEQYDAIPNTPS